MQLCIMVYFVLTGTQGNFLIRCNFNELVCHRQAYHSGSHIIMTLGNSFNILSSLFQAQDKKALFQNCKCVKPALCLNSQPHTLEADTLPMCHQGNVTITLCSLFRYLYTLLTSPRSNILTLSQPHTKMLLIVVKLGNFPHFVCYC